MKKALTLAIGGLVVAATAACGHSGDSGHSADYDAGYKAADGFTVLQLQMAAISCAGAYEAAPGGTNEDEFIKGCVAGVTKKGGTFDTSDPDGN